MDLSQRRCVVGRFSNHIEVENVLNKLYRAGFLVSQISIVAKYANCEQQFSMSSLYHSEDEVIDKTPVNAIIGSILGAVIGCLASFVMLTTSIVNSTVVIKGTFETAIITSLGATIGIVSGSIIPSLTSLEKASEQAELNKKSCQNEFLLIVYGTDEVVVGFKSTLSRACLSKVWIY